MHERETTNLASISVTSYALDSSNLGATDLRCLNEKEIRKLIHDEVKSKQMKGSVIIHTNFGPIPLLIHCNYAPLTCENFLELSESKYYDNTIFHRLIHDFIVS
jgi:hypothetical protein